jgi:hypothetical protein
MRVMAGARNRTCRRSNGSVGSRSKRTRRGDHRGRGGAGAAIGRIARTAGGCADVQAVVREGLGEVHVR